MRLEKALQTPAHIYYKYEGVSPAGSHKPNTAVAQAYYNKKAGTKRLATETGAGQWGSSLALACKLFGLECMVYMVKVSFHQKPYRKMLMQTWGATVHRQPERPDRVRPQGARGGPGLPRQPGHRHQRGDRGHASRQPNTKYSLGSVLNHVCLHQTVIGQEAIKQMEMAGEEPDVVIGCVGGGSNFAGIAFPFVQRQDQREEELPHRRRRAGVVPVADQGRVPLRLRRHGRDDAADDDVHARPRVHAAEHPRRRPALSRHGARWSATVRSSA